MPIYEWDCPVCGEFEMHMKVGEALEECPTCKSKVEKIFSQTGCIIWKCIGAHCTDYTNREHQANGKRFGKKIVIPKGG